MRNCIQLAAKASRKRTQRSIKFSTFPFAFEASLLFKQIPGIFAIFFFFLSNSLFDFLIALSLRYVRYQFEPELLQFGSVQLNINYLLKHQPQCYFCISMLNSLKVFGKNIQRIGSIPFAKIYFKI